MVEFVFVLPLLVILLFTIVELGIAFNRTQALHAAAREGARTASIGSTNAEIQARVTDALTGVTFSSPVVLDPVTNCAGRGGQQVSVVVRSTYNLTIPLLATWPLSLTGTGVFRCEG